LSCQRIANRLAQAATRVGISDQASRRTFYLGLATAGLLAGLLGVGPFWLRRQLRAVGGASVAGSSTVKTLSSLDRVEPIPTERLAGRRCANCRASSQDKRGWWYDLRGQAYCQDCAPDQAGKVGVSLALPTSAKSAPALPKYQEGRRIQLKPTLLSVGPLDHLEGYVVTAGGKETGLTITPEFKTEAGRVRVNQARWYVNYQRAGKPVAGPYSSLNEARSMAGLLAQFEWNRPVEDFSDNEIRAVAQVAAVYREELSLPSR
jgi:hypothetical protein